MEKPDRKVGAGAIGGAVAAVLVFVVEALAGVEIPAEVTAAIAVLASFGVAYFVPNPKPITES